MNPVFPVVWRFTSQRVIDFLFPSVEYFSLRVVTKMDEGYIFYAKMLGIPLPFEVLWDDDEGNETTVSDDVAESNVEPNVESNVENVNSNVESKDDAVLKEDKLCVAQKTEDSEKSLKSEEKKSPKSKTSKSKLVSFFKGLSDRRRKEVS